MEVVVGRFHLFDSLSVSTGISTRFDPLSVYKQWFNSILDPEL